MIKAYNRLFYAILYHYMKRRSGNESPEMMDAITVIVVLSCIMSCDVITLISLIRYFFIPEIVFSTFQGVAIALFVVITNAFLFLVKKRYCKIFYYYKESETDKKFKERNAWCVAFIVISLISMFVVP